MAAPKCPPEVFYLGLLESMFSDSIRWFPSMSDALSRDFQTICLRVRCEGFTFATKTLPLLGKAIDRGLEVGEFVRPREFKSNGNGRIPTLLGGLIARLFDVDGLVRAEPDVDAFKALRQICTFAYRLELPFADDAVRKTLDRFVSTEDELRAGAFYDYGPITRIAAEIAEGVLSGFDPRDITPRHGPGCVATGEKGEEKFEFKRLYRSIHRVYPYYDYFMVGGGEELKDRVSWYKGLERLESGRSKVVLVPKDSRGPRLICEEPLEYQWIQQGLGRALARHLQKKTVGRIQFTDQTVNQRLALESSITRRNATIDLKDASDRVSMRLVEALVPDLVPFLTACRSPEAQLPDGRVVQLSKHAAMGSALCFPIEALCFYCLCVASIEFERGVSRREAMRSVYVYGDDIVVPNEAYGNVTSVLESWRLAVNHDKSYTAGYFRESCGVDAFKGVDVTPVKPRALWSDDDRDGEALSSWVSYSNSFKEKGWARTGAYIREHVEALYGKVPEGTKTSGYVCWHVANPLAALSQNIDDGFKIRSNKLLQQPEIRALSLRSRIEDSVLDGWTRLLRNLTQGPGEFPDLSVVPRTTTMRWGWFRALFVLYFLSPLN